MNPKYVANLAGALLLSVALPAFGQDKPAPAQPLTEAEARVAAGRIIDAFNNAAAANDTARIAALFTDDSVRVTTTGETVIGRADIEKNYAKNFAKFKEDPATVEQVMLTGTDAFVVVGSWSGIWQSENGPVHLVGRYINTDVRVGADWKIAASMVVMGK